MHKDFDHDDMVANIVGTFGCASDDQYNAGIAWYVAAHDIVRAIAKMTGMQQARVCMALSALSPRNPWRWNVFDAYSFAVARASGRTMPTATTFKRNWLAAWRALDPTVIDPWLTAALKVRAFVAAITGDVQAVVVDTWAVKVATAGRRDRVGTDRQYRAVAAAYTAAAEQLGNITPRDLQAVTWLVAQTEGLASRRRGRHDLSFKAGTPDFIKAALAEGSIA